MLKSILYIICLLLPFAAFAQKGCFKAYAPSGAEISVLCINQDVTFQDCGNVVPDDKEYYVFDYKSGTPIPAVSSPIKKHTYTTPGKYRVLQIANYGGSTLTDTVSQVFEVKATPAPSFTVTACANNSVVLNITDTNYSNYEIDYGDGSAPVMSQKGTAPIYTYANTNTYTITVTGKYAGGECNGTATKQVSTLPVFKVPTLQNLVVKQQGNSGEIQLDLANLQPGYMYIIERWQDPRTNFQKLDTIKNVTQSSLSYTLRNLNTAEGVWYLVRIADVCNSINTRNNSNIVSGLKLEATPGNEQVQLQWQSMPWADKYEVYRNNSLISTLNSSTSSFKDEGLTCGQTYAYFIKGIANDGSTSVSATQNVQVTSTSTPVAPYLLASFTPDNQIELSVTIPQGIIAQKVEIERSINNGTFTLLSTGQQTTIQDKLQQIEAVCYRAKYTDACNNASQLGNEACPMILTTQLQIDGSIQLSWAPYKGFVGGVKQYTVELLDGSGAVVASYNTPGTSYTDKTLNNDLQVLRYRIKATPASGSGVSYSNTEQIEQEMQIYVPSAFTPNNDGLNDELEIKGKFISSYTLKVFNSQGNVVFETLDGSINWNGTYEGKPLPAGVYAYELVVKTSFGVTKRRTGTVTLLR